MATRPFRVAVVGAGPAGFYAAEALLRAPEQVAVDLYDRLPTPYGLVRYGVAPDHAKLKQVTATFQTIADLPGFRFFGNVAVGSDIGIADLKRHYHAVVIACGAERDQPLGIPGAGLAGVHGGMAFVGWYNGHPDRADLAPDLSGRTALVIGIGNVALDVARILSKPVDLLASTDIADHALEALTRSRIERVVVAARGGPAQARCTEKELREFGSLPGCAVTADTGHHGVAPATGVPALFNAFPSQDGDHAPRRCHFAFGLQPQAILGEGKVRGVRFASRPIRDGIAVNDPQANRVVDVEADIVIACIGNRATIVPGMEQDEGDRIVANEGGRVRSGRGVDLGLYVAGWIKRGASGTIGTNRACAVETIAALRADLAALPDPELPVDALEGEFRLKSLNVISFDQWKIIDQQEIEKGRSSGRTRVKIVPKESILRTIYFNR
ncbi:FAD-dependent oxidoreductase [Sphingobium sp. Sx8-8]|uniref:FAD-dependent oxidoreductase n=1 Tax=Sphingobium sp. Sx8-8 TaxID=2933617 RepID=UPI001F587BAA|nr:FAD-dependent oxidoreductase [Sphingobium sp. Sx8-8]